jgi:pimeloyl-ACP methyl ester carboxylesterase
MPRVSVVFFAAALAYFGACIPAAVTPLQTRVVPAVSGNDAPALIYLPGMGDSITVFEANGMLDSLRAAGLDAEFVACNAHYGYYANRSLLERVQQDVVKSERVTGHAKVWLVGNSMGGLGSLLFASRQPGVVQGIVLLGPFISRGRVSHEIEAAGGLKAWNPTVSDTADWERRLWLWLKNCAAGSDTSCPAIYLGYGRADRLATEHKLLAAVLPPEHVVALEGGHDWPIWRSAWGELLRRGALQ